jgi:NADH dehydrogenase
MSERIVVVGGGFGGVKCARTLRHLLSPEQAEVILFNRENHMVFHPLLAEVVSAAVQPKDVGAPLRQLLKGVQCRSCQFQPGKARDYLRSARRPNEIDGF